MKNKLNKLMELAEAQILGFCHCYQGFGLEELLSSMGLDKDEWEVIKNEMNIDYIPEELFKEIEEYLTPAPKAE